MLAFARTLSPKFTQQVLAQVTYHLLKWYREMDLHSSQRAKDLFLDYVVYPRGNSKKYSARNSSIWRCSYTVLSPVTESQDDELLKAYLTDHYMQANITKKKPFSLYLGDMYLKNIIATAKLLGGHNELEWCSLLSDPVQSIKERVEIQFLACNKQKFSTSDSVSLSVEIKNISTLIIKVSGKQFTCDTKFR
jgi:hypothetical protein